MYIWINKIWGRRKEVYFKIKVEYVFKMILKILNIIFKNLIDSLKVNFKKWIFYKLVLNIMFYLFVLIR